MEELSETVEHGEDMWDDQKQINWFDTWKIG